jgi:RimJ/RimL family protein N-acetyltransferase
MTAIIKKRNRRCRKLAEGLGFKLEGVMRKGAPDGDLFFYGLLKDEYMKGKFYGTI